MTYDRVEVYELDVRAKGKIVRLNGGKPYCTWGPRDKPLPDLLKFLDAGSTPQAPPQAKTPQQGKKAAQAAAKEAQADGKKKKKAGCCIM